MSSLTQEAIRILRALYKSGGRLHGRLDQHTPFVLAAPGGSDTDCKVEVPAAVAEALHDVGWIQIDEAAPITDIYVFEVSREGKAYLNSLTDAE
jgi:hypothetical protein